MTDFTRDDSHSDAERQAIEATAGVWLSLRDRGMTPGETEAFVRWLQADTRHASVFEGLDQAWRQLDQLSASVLPNTRPNPDSLAPRFRRRLAKTPVFSMAAAVALALVCAALWLQRPQKHFAETAVGAFQKVDLPDGSVAQLNTDSAIDADMSGPERRVRVVRGEVHFSVHKDAVHPFVVTAEGIQVIAVGTAFNVRTEPKSVEVMVTEGKVRLNQADYPKLADSRHGAESESPPLSAGEKASIDIDHISERRIADAMKVAKVSASEIRRVLAWQERRIEFDSTPFNEVAAEFNRYNRVKLVVTDPALGSQTFSGTFRADGYNAFVAILEQNFGVRVTREADQVLLAKNVSAK
ncbi:MAG TPA: FecR domain-containing protein [Opitutaceae bacterium]|nr:FecR domain-containing protein [Opitutaceae bacterium]